MLNVLWPPFHILWDIHTLPNLWRFVVPSFPQLSSCHSLFSSYFPLPVIALDFWNCNPLSPASFALAHLKDKQGQKKSWSQNSHECLEFSRNSGNGQKLGNLSAMVKEDLIQYVASLDKRKKGDKVVKDDCRILGLDKQEDADTGKPRGIFDFGWLLLMTSAFTLVLEILNNNGAFRR